MPKEKGRPLLENRIVSPLLWAVASSHSYPVIGSEQQRLSVHIYMTVQYSVIFAGGNKSRIYFPSLEKA